MKVFISHSSKDKDVAKNIAASLERAGFTVWDAENEILPGDNWADMVAKALREAEAMVVLLSHDALQSSWVRREIEFALGDKRFKNRLIPVVVESLENLPDENFPWILKRLHMIELRKTGEKAALGQITKARIDAA